MENTEKSIKLNKAMEEFSKRLQEAEKVLEYSLYLKKVLHLKNQRYMPISNDSISDCIENLIEGIWKDCDAFINDGELNFYGYKDSAFDLSTLYCKPYFWKHVLKQDAIISAFIKLRKVIGESYSMTDTKRMLFSNYASENFDKCHNGFDYLLKPNQSSSCSPYLTLETTEDGYTPTIIDQNRECKVKKDDRFYGNTKHHIERIHTLNNKLKNAEISTLPLYLSPKINSGIEPECLPSLLEFYNLTVERLPRDECKGSATNIQPIIDAHTEKKAFSPSTYKKYIGCISRLLHSIRAEDLSLEEYVKFDSTQTNTPDIAPKFALSDKIYLLYQIETVFAPCTIDCLYQNVIQTKGEKYALDDQSSINILAACLKLPNVFTRQYILQMAVDTISKHFDYDFKDSDFFTKKMDSSDAVMTYARSKYNYLNNFYKSDAFKSRYRNALNYLTEILFPVFENYFFCALWNIVKDAYKDATDAQIVIEMYKLLQTYLNNQNNVKELFATNDKINMCLKEETKIKTENIISASFIYNDKANKSSNKFSTRLYKKCLIAHNSIYTDRIIPDFISLSYLDEIAGQHHKQIQDLYILEAAMFKR